MFNSSERRTHRETDRRAGMTSGQLVNTLVTSSANSPANQSGLDIPRNHTRYIGIRESNIKSSRVAGFCLT